MIIILLPRQFVKGLFYSYWNFILQETQKTVDKSGFPVYTIDS